MTRVLIVDDQETFRRQLRRLFERAGFEVVGEAGDISAARKLVRKHRPDIAVVDLMLPGKSGLAGISVLKAEHPPLRVYLVSAYHDQAHVFATSAEEAGAEAFLPKEYLDLEEIETWK
jgi:DNA-binding NarL/FixJ family response regulator